MSEVAIRLRTPGIQKYVIPEDIPEDLLERLKVYEERKASRLRRLREERERKEEEELPKPMHFYNGNPYLRESDENIYWNAEGKLLLLNRRSTLPAQKPKEEMDDMEQLPKIQRVEPKRQYPPFMERCLPKKVEAPQSYPDKNSSEKKKISSGEQGKFLERQMEAAKRKQNPKEDPPMLWHIDEKNAKMAQELRVKRAEKKKEEEAAPPPPPPESPKKRRGISEHLLSPRPSQKSEESGTKSKAEAEPKKKPPPKKKVVKVTKEETEKGEEVHVEVRVEAPVVEETKAEVPSLETEDENDEMKQQKFATDIPEQTKKVLEQMKPLRDNE
jgi:hypothetical protein